jgi:hypothetical protein
MKMNNKKNTVFLSIIFIIFLAACSHYDDLQKNSKQSSAGDDESHNTGQDCMSCHNKSGHEATFEGWWNVAGSVYNSGSPANNVTVELWSGKKGTGYKILSLVSDKKGNFYTNKIINFNGGCYPRVISGNKIKDMDQIFTGNASCSSTSCHGGTQSKIDIN